MSIIYKSLNNVLIINRCINYSINNKFRQLLIILINNLILIMDSQPRYAMVEKIIGRTGSRGGITQVQVCFLDVKKRKLLRNVTGPVREKDVLSNIFFKD